MPTIEVKETAGFRVTYSVQQNIGSNTSTIRVTGLDVNNYLGYTGFWTHLAGTIAIAGKTLITLDYVNVMSNGTTWASVQLLGQVNNSVTVAHDANGNKSVEFAIFIDVYNRSTGTWLCSYSGRPVYALPQIPRQRTISISGENATVSCSRLSSPRAGAGTGPVVTGSVLYDGDVISVNYAFPPGYTLEHAAVNGNPIVNGGQFSVGSNVVVSVSGKVQGAGYLGGKMYQPYIGGKQYIPYVFMDGNWRICG